MTTVEELREFGEAMVFDGLRRAGLRTKSLSLRVSWSKGGAGCRISAYSSGSTASEGDLDFDKIRRADTILSQFTGGGPHVSWHIARSNWRKGGCYGLRTSELTPWSRICSEDRFTFSFYMTTDFRENDTGASVELDWYPVLPEDISKA